MLRLIVILFLISVFISCKSSTEPNIVVPGSQFYPLSIGNYWQYEESFSSDDTSYINSYTSTITKVEEIGGYSWFKIENKRKNCTESRYLMLEKDSVYELQYNFKNPIRSLVYINPSEKEISFYSLFGGDAVIIKTVTKLDTIIKTKVGNFKNCLKYKYSVPDWTIIEILAAGIGIIEKQIIGYKPGG